MVPERQGVGANAPYMLPRPEIRFEILSVRSCPTGPVVAALERGTPSMTIVLAWGHPRSIAYPDRHACRGDRLDPACASAGYAAIGDHPDIDAALLGPDQRPGDPGVDREAVGANG
jgi:hypothetical protein